MERSDAERVFALVNEINGDLRGRIVSERWWLVWIAAGFHMLIGSAILRVVLWRGEERTAVLVGLLASFAIVLFLMVRFIHRNAGASGRRPNHTSGGSGVVTSSAPC